MYERAETLDPAECTDANRCQVITETVDPTDATRCSDVSNVA